MSHWYKLVNRIPVPCGRDEGFADIEALSVAHETVGTAEVSTVFLGLDQNLGYGPPMLFESMVFGGALDREQDCCSTWEQAEEMHRKMVARVAGAAVAGVVR